MKKKNLKLPTVDRLLELFDYDPFNGLLIRKSTGKEAGGFNKERYRVVTIDRVKYYVHRIVYKMFYRKDPGHYVIDHINGNPHDNSIENLRRCYFKTNLRNNMSKRLSCGNVPL